MNGRISVGQGIAIAGIWIAVAAVAVASLPFALLIVPIAVPAAAVWGAVVVTRMILGQGRIKGSAIGQEDMMG